MKSAAATAVGGANADAAETAAVGDARQPLQQQRCPTARLENQRHAFDELSTGISSACISRGLLQAAEFVLVGER